MYSLMSMRTIACSSSNRNSASALAVSVFPTPVGPRKMKLPIGRFGSLSPARERRIAFATTTSASSCPTTRSRSRCSICVSFCTSPSSIFDTGIPVHFDTIRAISSSSTSSFSSRDALPPAFASATLASCDRRQLRQLLLRLRNLAILQLRRALQIALARSLGRLKAHLLQPLLQRRNLANRSLLLLPARTQSSRLLLHLGKLAVHLNQPFPRVHIVLALQRIALNLQTRRPPLQIINLHRHRPNLNRQRRRRLIHQINRLIRQEPVAEYTDGSTPPPPQSPSP